MLFCAFVHFCVHLSTMSLFWLHRKSDVTNNPVPVKASVCGEDTVYNCDYVKFRFIMAAVAAQANCRRCWLVAW